MCIYIYFYVCIYVHMCIYSYMYIWLLYRCQEDIYMSILVFRHSQKSARFLIDCPKKILNSNFENIPALSQVATHCDTLQRTALQCNALTLCHYCGSQAATHRNTLQHCNMLQYTDSATQLQPPRKPQHTATHCNRARATGPQAMAPRIPRAS